MREEDKNKTKDQAQEIDEFTFECSTLISPPAQPIRATASWAYRSRRSIRLPTTLLPSSAASCR